MLSCPIERIRTLLGLARFDISKSVLFWGHTRAASIFRPNLTIDALIFYYCIVLLSFRTTGQALHHTMIASWFCTCSSSDFRRSSSLNIDVAKDISGVSTALNLWWLATLGLPGRADQKVVAVLQPAACVKSRAPLLSRLQEWLSCFDRLNGQHRDLVTSFRETSLDTL